MAHTEQAACTVRGVALVLVSALLSGLAVRRRLDQLDLIGRSANLERIVEDPIVGE